MLKMRLVIGIALIGVMVMLIGVMTTPCETLKADGVGAGQQFGNMLLPVEHACEYICEYIWECALAIEHACENRSR